MTWTLKEGELLFNNSSINAEYDDIEKLVLKTSHNGNFIAVCNINDYYADFYTSQAKDGYKHYMYSLKRNTYRTENTEYILEFFQSPSNPNETLFIFNADHGELGVYDAETGRQLHTDDIEDKFITSIKIVDDKFIHMTGWYWSPVFFTSIYNIKELLTVPEYKAVILDTDRDIPISDKHIRLNADNDIEIFSDGHPYHKCIPLDEFYKNHEKIIAEKEDWEFTKVLTSTKNNFIHRILSIDDINIEFLGKSRENLTYIVNDDNMLVNGECKGNNSGFNLKSNIYLVAKEITISDENLNYLFPKLLFHGFYSNLHELKEINLTFTFTKQDISVKMIVYQKMKPMENKTCSYEVDENEPCRITLE